MTVEATAGVPEDLPTGKRSRTEAKEEDVEMEEVKEEEPPQVDPDASLAPEEEAPDFEGDVEIDDDVSETASQKHETASLRWMKIFHLHSLAWNVTFFMNQQDKHINDFIPTRCHFLNHLNLKKESRLKCQSHSAQKTL